ncbi:MAG: TolC family protein [Calditrichaeota bacterium]|nr:TolC family protein [Calditrichota bacterium]
MRKKLLMGSEYSVPSPPASGGMKGGCNDYLITPPLTPPRKRGGKEYSVPSPPASGGMKGGCNDCLITPPLTPPRKRGGKDNHTANYIPHPLTAIRIRNTLTRFWQCKEKYHLFLYPASGVVFLFILLIIAAFLPAGASCAAEPLPIDEAVRQAVGHHPQTAVAKSLVAEARGLQRSAIALNPPNLFVRWDDIPSGQGISDFAERRIGISQEFDFPLRYVWQAKKAALSFRQAQYESLILLADLESDVKKAYLEAWSHSEQAIIYKEFADTFGYYGQRIQAMGARGEYSPLLARDYALKARLAEAEDNSVRRRMTAAFEKLTALLKVAPDEFELISPLKSNPIDTMQLTAFTPESDAPQLFSAATALRIREYERTLAKNGWLPEFQLNYFKRFEFDRRDNDSWALEIEMTIPLWFWQEGIGDIRTCEAQTVRARAELSAAQMRFKAERQLLIQEIVSGFEQMMLYQTEVVPAAGEKMQFVRRNVQLGGANFIEFLNEWTEYRDVMLKDIEIKTELYLNKIRLDELLGVTIAADGSNMPIKPGK